MKGFRRFQETKMGKGLARIRENARQRIERIKKRARLFRLAPFSRAPPMKNAHARLQLYVDRANATKAELYAEATTARPRSDYMNRSMKKMELVDRLARKSIVRIAFSHAGEMVKLTQAEKTEIERIRDEYLEGATIQNEGSRKFLAANVTRKLIQTIGKKRADRFSSIFVIQNRELNDWFNEKMERQDIHYLDRAQTMDKGP